MSEPLYASDQQISTTAEDRFNRWPFAKRVADTIATRAEHSSLIVGIYGPWGDGKTSVLRLMQHELSSHQNVAVVWFNPWHFESQDELIRGFFTTLADTLKRKLGTKLEELGGVLSKYGALLSPVGLGGVKEAGASLSTVGLDELKLRIEQILRESSQRVVVLVDDIDRLDRSEIHSLFKLVKLSAGFENVSYVLAFDDEVVAAALGERYGLGDARAGRSFLEKIVQVPLHLPPPEQIALRQLAFDGVNAALKQASIDLTQSDVQRFVRDFVTGLESRLTTPRQARRLGNALAFALPLLKGEVDVVDQMLIEGVRVFFPKLYGTIRDNPEVFLQDEYIPDHAAGERKKRCQTVIDSALEGLVADEADGVKRMLQELFPRLKGTYGNTFYGRDWDKTWREEQRICTSAYFNRYFSYAIPPRDVSDQRIGEIISAAESGADNLDDAIRATIDRGSASRLVEKLRARAASVNPEAARHLSLVVARNGQLFPQEPGAFSALASTAMQAAMLVAQLVMQVPDEDRSRSRLALEVIATANPLPFAVECLRWLQRDKEAVIVPEDVEATLGKTLAGRIAAQAVTEPPYLQWPGDASGLLWVWRIHGPNGEITAYLERRLEVNGVADAVALLMAFTPIAWGLESGLSHRSDFREDGYKAVSGFVSPDLLFQILRGVYGETLDNAEFHQSRQMPDEERVAHQFAFLHRRAKAEGTGSTRDQAESGPTVAPDEEVGDPTIENAIEAGNAESPAGSGSV
jgi:hypothetical protein